MIIDDIDERQQSKTIEVNGLKDVRVFVDQNLNGIKTIETIKI